tara:strand:- start:4894 stop:5274 length:381 start_codon:yes stop_codon:yes gene_type:complete
LPGPVDKRQSALSTRVLGYCTRELQLRSSRDGTSKTNFPSYRKHKSGQARVTINGRDHYLGEHGTKASKAEYDRLIAEYLASGRSISFGADSGEMTLAVLMVEYFRHAKSYYGTGDASEWHRINLR